MAYLLEVRKPFVNISRACPLGVRKTIVTKACLLEARKPIICRICPLEVRNTIIIRVYLLKVSIGCNKISLFSFVLLPSVSIDFYFMFL